MHSAWSLGMCISNCTRAAHPETVHERRVISRPRVAATRARRAHVCLCVRGVCLPIRAKDTALSLSICVDAPRCFFTPPVGDMCALGQRATLSATLRLCFSLAIGGARVCPVIFRTGARCYCFEGFRRQLSRGESKFEYRWRLVPLNCRVV